MLDFVRESASVRKSYTPHTGLSRARRSIRMCDEVYHTERVRGNKNILAVLVIFLISLASFSARIFLVDAIQTTPATNKHIARFLYLK